jgi:hypothetical protein
MPVNFSSKRKITLRQEPQKAKRSFQVWMNPNPGNADENCHRLIE